MGSSKRISGREIACMVLLLQQGGVFWLLPYLLCGETGSAGLLALLPGLAAGAAAILICVYWRRRCPEQELLTGLTAGLGRPLGKLTGLGLLAVYAAFAVLCLSSFVEAVHGDLLRETPPLVIACAVFLLVGWLSWNGLEDVSRIAVLCVLPLAVLILLAVAGSWRSFSWETMLPLQSEPQPLWQAARYSVFAYGGLLTLFIAAPAVNRRDLKAAWLLAALVVSSGIFVLWTVLALGVFGQHSIGSMLWLPLELARMFQISSFLERTEALFAMLWMALVFVNGSLLVWSTAEAARQLLGCRRNGWLHGAVVLGLLLLCLQIRGQLQLLQLARFLSLLGAGLVPALLLLLLAGGWRCSRREEAQREEDHETEYPEKERLV